MRATPTSLEDCQRTAALLDTRLAGLSGLTVLLTGANGFLIGSLVGAMAAWNDLRRGEPIRVLAVDNNLTGTSDRLDHLKGRADLRLITHDVRHPIELDEPVHWIVHGASIASPSVYRRHPLETIDANVGGTRHMLELARQHQVHGMLVLSTSEIYGDPDPTMIPTPESYRGNVSCTGPRACYDESKRMAETLAAIYHDLYGVRVVTIRPFNVYGPCFRLDDRRVLPDFMSAVLARRPIALLSDGRPSRTFCYVTDATRAMLLLLLDGAAGEPYNVGNDQGEISMLDLARLTADTGRKLMRGPAVDVTFQTSDDPAYLVDNPNRRCPDLTKLRGAIDWQPTVDLPEGLERMLKSYLELGLGANDG